MKNLKIAIPKGYLYQPTVKFLTKIGFGIDFDSQESRKLSIRPTEDSPEFLLVRAKDVPRYVEYGAADLGITGQDVLLEKGFHLCELFDLGFGACKMILAAKNTEANKYKELENLRDKRVATNYSQITLDYFYRKGFQVEIIELYGSVELAPIFNLADLITDLSVTGQTLKENGLTIIDTIQEYTARLVANNVSYQLKREKINGFNRRVKSVIEKE